MIGILRDQDLSIGVRKFGRRFTASGAGALSWETIESLRRHPPSISPCKQDLLQSFFFHVRQHQGPPARNSQRRVLALLQHLANNTRHVRRRESSQRLGADVAQCTKAQV